MSGVCTSSAGDFGWNTALGCKLYTHHFVHAASVLQVEEISEQAAMARCREQLGSGGENVRGSFQLQQKTLQVL